MNAALCILAGLALVGQAPADKDLLAAAQKQAQVWASAFAAGDVDKLTALTPPTVVKQAGGKEKWQARLRAEFEQVKRNKVKLLRYTARPAQTIHRAGKDLIVFVPMRIEAERPDGKATHDNHLLGASADAGKTWTFLDPGRFDEDDMRAFFPGWPADLRLPAPGKEVVAEPAGGVFSSAEGNFKVRYPKGWQKTSPPDSAELEVVRRKQSLNVTPDFNNVPPEAMVAGILGSLRDRPGSTYKELGRDKVKVAGIETVMVHFQLKVQIGLVQAWLTAFEHQGVTYKVLAAARADETVGIEADLKAVLASFAFLGERKQWREIEDSKPARTAFLAGLASIELRRPRWKETTLDSQQPRNEADGEELQFQLYNGAATLVVRAAERRSTVKAELDDLQRSYLQKLENATAKRMVFKGPKGFLSGVELTGNAGQTPFRVLGCAFVKDGFAVQLSLEFNPVQATRVQKDWEQLLASVRFADPKTAPALFSPQRHFDDRPPNPALAVLLKKATLLYPGTRMHEVHSISADGQQALILGRDGVFVENVRDRSRIALGPNQFGGAQPSYGIPASWSRDGKQIAYAVAQAVIVRSLRDKEVAEHKGRATALAFLGDGRLLVADAGPLDVAGRYQRFGQQKLVRYEEDEAKPVLTFPLARFAHLAVSPDGKQLALVTNKDGPRTSPRPGNLHVANADGTDLRQLTKGPESIHSVAWSDDGRWLYVVRRTGPEGGLGIAEGDLYKIAADTGAADNLTRCGKIDTAWVQGDHLLIRVRGGNLPINQSGIYRIAAADLAGAAATLPARDRADVAEAAKKLAGRLEAAFAPRPLAEVVPTADVLAKLADTFAAGAIELLGEPFDFSGRSLDSLPRWASRLAPAMSSEPALLHGMGAYYGETLRRLSKAEWRLEPLPLGRGLPVQGRAPSNAVAEVVLPFSDVFRAMTNFGDGEDQDWLLITQARLQRNQHKLVLAYPPASAERALRAATPPAYLKAYEHFDKGEIKTGLELLAPVVREYPNNVQLALDVLELADAAKVPALADAMAEAAVAAGSTVPEWLARRADALVKSDPKQALELYRKAAQAPLPPAGVYLKLGVQLDAAGQRPLAETCFRRAWQIGNPAQQAEARQLLGATPTTKRRD